MNQEQLAYFIEAYRSNELDAQERQSLRTVLAKNPDLLNSFTVGLQQQLLLHTQISRDQGQHSADVVMNRLLNKRTSKYLAIVNNVERRIKHKPAQSNTRRTQKKSQTRRSQRHVKKPATPFMAIAFSAAALVLFSFIYYTQIPKSDQQTQATSPQNRIEHVHQVASSQPSLLHIDSGSIQSENQLLSSGKPLSSDQRYQSHGDTTLSGPSIGSIFLSAATEFSFQQLPHSILIRVYGGTCKGTIRKQAAQHSIVFRGNYADAIIVGTQIEFAVSPSQDRLTVNEGSVNFQHQQSKQIQHISTTSGQTPIPYIADSSGIRPQATQTGPTLIDEVETFMTLPPLPISNKQENAAVFEPILTASGKLLVALPRIGSRIVLDKIPSGYAFMQLRWGDDNEHTISFNILVDGKIIKTVSGVKTKDYFWAKVVLPTDYKVISIVSLYDATTATKDEAGHPYGTVVRIDKIAFYNDPHWAP